MSAVSAVTAALAIIDADGHEAVSIRRLARELNYSRSGLAYRIGSMPELEVEVFSTVADELVRAMFGDGPVDLEDPAWMRAALGDALGRRVDIEQASVHFLISSFALMLDIVRLFGDRERALDAVTSHCAGTWRTLVLAAREPVAA